MDIESLREELETRNGISDLEIYSPDQVEAITNAFHRDGFVVVKNVLTSKQVKFLRQGCEREAAEVVAADTERVGNRGRNRYSWGSASITNSMFHREEWVMLVDLQTVLPTISHIFGSDDYHVRRGAGDFCLPGADYQRLHADIGDHKKGFFDPRGNVSIRDLPCPVICCNFLAQDFTKINGPTRQIPGTQNSRESIPDLENEPPWMKFSTVCPAPAGSVLIRDIRAWHGGTPNLSEEMRAIPNVIYLAPWFRERQAPSMPRGMFDLLSDHGRQICESVVTDEPLDTGYSFTVPAMRSML